jgi:ferric-dicitrate binding protein FerR (iron transport regulator)
VNDDYLWDRSGEPDPEVARLEQLLGRFGVRQRQLPPSRRRLRRRTPRWLAAAAAIILLIGAAAFTLRFHWRSGAPWEIQSVHGAPIVEGEIVKPKDRLGVGETIVTDSRSRVTVQIARVGELEIGPGSEVELVATSRGRHRIALRRGVVNARVWAPPFTFGVTTPAGLASDVGCAFTLQYGASTGVVRVTSGWVDFDGDVRSSMIPAGAIAELQQDLGPGTPYWDDAPAALRDALRDYDATGSDDALRRVLDAARPRDAMTVHHMLERERRLPQRGVLFDHLAKMAPPPPGVTREGVLERNMQMMDAWRESLGLGGIKKWWLHWRDALPVGDR